MTRAGPINFNLITNVLANKLLSDGSKAMTNNLNIINNNNKLINVDGLHQIS